MTKKQQGMYNSYLNTSATKLRDVYTSWSKKKEDAMETCRCKQAELNGYDGRIPTASGWQFTYAFRYRNPNTNKEHLHYITKTADYDFCIEED